MADSTKPPTPPQLTDGPQAIKNYIRQWFESRGVPIEEKLQNLILQVSWTGRDLRRPLWVVRMELEDWGFAIPHANGIAADIRRDIEREEVCQISLLSSCGLGS